MLHWKILAATSLLTVIIGASANAQTQPFNQPQEPLSPGEKFMLTPPTPSCVVANPNGDKLNVRTMPNGKITGTVSDGMHVQIFDESSTGYWVFIGDAKQNYGWVARHFLNCAT